MSSIERERGGEREERRETETEEWKLFYRDLFICFFIFYLSIILQGCPLMYLVFTRMPGESYRRRLRLRSLMYLCYVFRALINSFAC